MSDDEQYVFIPEGPTEKSSIEPYDDPFMHDWDVIKGLSGFNDSATKRRITRKVNSVTPKYIESAKTNPTGSGSSSKQLNPGDDYINGYGVFDVVTPPYNLYQMASFYDSNFANHAAIDAKALNAVGSGYRFDMTRRATQKMLDNSSQDSIDKINKKIDKLRVETESWLEGMNDHQSFTETMMRVVIDLEATGNGYIEIGRTTSGQIGYVGHIPSATMRVRRLKDGYVQIISNRVVYFRNFGANNYDPIGNDPKPNEIIHFKKYSPLNAYYGVPDIVSAMNSLVGDQFAEQYNIDYFENKAVPRYLITTKGVKLSSDSEDRLFRFLQTGLKGQNHRTLYVPLPGDTADNKTEFKMEPVENKVQEASFSQFRKDNRNNILMAHQVPLSKLGSPDAASVASAMSQDRTFRDQVCRPMQKMLENVISKIIKEFTDMIELKFEEVNIVDEVQRSTIHKTYSDMNVMKPNEIRAEIGMPAIKGLDDEQKKQQAQSIADRNNQRIQQASDNPNAAVGRNPKGSGAKEDGNIV